MTNTALFSLQALFDHWKELPALCGGDWPGIELQLERVFERLYAGVELDVDAYLAAQLQIAFKGHADVLERLFPPVTRGGPPRSAATTADPTTRGRGPAVRTRGGFAPVTRGGQSETPRVRGALASDNRELVATLAGRVRDLLTPRTVTRFVDLSCPDRVALQTPRFTLVIRLPTSASDVSAAGAVRLVESGKVQIRLDAPGFDVIGPSEQEVNVADSPPVIFDLRPRKAGRHRIIIDFFQDRNHVGSVDHDVLCTEAEGTSFAERPVPLRNDPTAIPPDMVLLVSTRGSELTFTLMQQGGAWGKNFTSIELRDPALYATQLYRDLTGLVVRSEPVAAAHDVKPEGYLKPSEIDRSVRILGRNLWNIFPKDFKELYAKHRDEWRGRSLLLLSDEPHVPWELVWPYGEGYADDTPWCCTYQMTRWLRLDDHGGGSEGPPARLRMRSLAILAPEDAGLPSARKELEDVSKLVGSRGVKILTPGATLDNVLTLLEQGGYDWLHVAAHGKFHKDSPDGHSALWLEGRRPFTPASIVGPEVEAHIRLSRPAFVFNACEGGRQGQGLTGLAGWASRLVGRGAGLFAGALWEITDEAALAFVSDFYARILDGVTVGEALRQARLRARKAGDPTWLAYSVYAHPNATIDLN